MTKELLQQLHTELAAYQGLHFGARYGEDFPALASLLVTMPEFYQDELVLIAVITAELPRLLDAIKDSQLAGAKVEKLGKGMRGTEFEFLVLHFIYWGYRAGRQAADIERLETMSGKKDDRQP